MNPSPRISVCVPVYNAAPYLGECIDSILTQTYTDFELLLADDGSTDGSAEIAASYSDPRIRLIRGPHDYVGTLWPAARRGARRVYRPNGRRRG